MKYLRQFLIILAISFAGETLHHLIPMPIPASIYGILILFILLETKILPLSAVKETGKFLIEIMPVMFIPAAVGLLESWNILKGSWVSYAVITVCTTFLVMIVSGHVTQAMIRHGKSIGNDETGGEDEESAGSSAGISESSGTSTVDASHDLENAKEKGGQRS